MADRVRDDRVSVFVVDDHPVLRKGLVALFDAEADFFVSGEAGTVAEAEAAICANTPDVAVIDLVLGDESGLDLVTRVARASPSVRMLVLSARDEGLYAESALKSGALGYVMKVRPPEELVAAVRHVAAGKSYVSADTANRILAALSPSRGSVLPRTPLERLSDRERQVLTLLGKGLTTREIALQLQVSIKTVESHYAHMKDKLGARNGRDLMRLAVTLT